ncbi:MAG: tetratricopeptide repeat protein, partial [Phycisphaerae bacterium]|nr:tetratricopeptide repeat protein [Phycisphaerae bacterium]
RGNWTALPDMLAYVQRPDRDEVYAASLVRLLRACEDSRKWPVLIRALRDASPLVRSASAEALGDHVTPDSLPALLEATRDEYRVVRVRAAAALAAAWRLDLAEADRHSLRAATAEFLEAMRCRPDDPASHYNLGSFHADRGEHAEALACYAQAHRLDPRDIAPLVNASLVYNALGRNDQAEQSLRRALQIEPTSYPAQLNLGMLLGELGRTPEAEEAFRAALRLEPKSATAAYNLGVIVAGRDATEGIVLLKKACQWRPDEPRYAFAVAYHLHRSGAAEEAVLELRQMLAAHPSYADGYALLGDILVEQGRVSEAAELYRRAGENEHLPVAARREFAERASRLSSP